MENPFNFLARALEAELHAACADRQYWIGLAGAPGSGKSTLSAALKARMGDCLAVIPMDGYHFTRAQLAGFPDPDHARARRGAPFTFDSERFVADLIRARRDGQGSFPSFDHGRGDPVEGAICLTADTPFVLVEGNYLLLDESPWSRLRHEVFDDTWFLQVPVSIARERVFQRHQRTGKSADVARIRVETNDGPNAERVNRDSPPQARRIFTLEDLR